MPSRIFYRLLLILVSVFNIFAANSAYASNTTKIVELQSLANQQQLWLNPEWLKLLHYYQHGTNFISQVDDTNFFTAADGKTNPQSEMLATLAAFYNEQTDSDALAQCRFPARRQWLNQQLNNQLTELPSASCADRTRHV